MRYLITGSSGQLGTALVERLGDEVVWAGGRHELDVGDAAAVERVVKGSRPDVVLNAAAYNAVDRAETEVAECFRVNAAGPRYLARAALEVGALIVHVSSDYVFDGEAAEPYTEDDVPRPLNVYGVSKLAGEMIVRASGCPYLVARTSAVFGAGGSRIKGGSFVERILEKARAGEKLTVVADQVCCPTYAPDLAEAILGLVGHGARGLYHVTNAGSCTWHAFAEAVLQHAGFDAEVEPVRTRDRGVPARRPLHTILSKERYEALGLPPLRTWSEALAAFMSG